MSLRSSFMHSSMELWGELLVIGDERVGAEIALESLTELVSKVICTAQKKVSTKDFFNKCGKILLRIWLHLLKKSLMENFTFCTVLEWRSQDSRKALTVVAKLFILDVLEGLE